MDFNTREMPAMTFGERIRQLRKAKNLNQSELADKVGINFTYLSKIENDKVASSEFPSEETIKKLPDSIKKRVIERPDAFRKFAALDDDAIDKLLEELGEDE